MKQKGFTLIELMIVISITALLGVLAMAGYSNYNKSQVLQTSVNDVVSMLNLAKSRAQSQIKPPQCTDVLNGYRVKISEASSEYALYVSCGANDDHKIVEEDKSLPLGLSFSNDSSFFFPVQTGRVQASNSWQIVISGSGITKIITINTLGVINQP